VAVEFFGSCEVAPLEDDAEGENVVCGGMEISDAKGGNEAESDLFHADRQVQPHAS
jgi:hypothetical protein